MAIDNLEGKADKIVGKVQSQVGKVAGDEGMQAEGAVRQVGGQAKELYGDAKDAIDTAASAMSDAIGDGYDRGGRLTQQRFDKAAATVRTSPVLSLLAAAAFGYVLALAIHR
jgi:uncharacterized protein YjbJ (UPF0337 family)